MPNKNYKAYSDQKKGVQIRMIAEEASKSDRIRYAFFVLQEHVDQLTYNGALTGDDADEMNQAINYLRNILEVK